LIFVLGEGFLDLLSSRQLILGDGPPRS